MIAFNEFVNGRNAPSDDLKVLSAKIKMAFMEEFPNGWIGFRGRSLGGKGFNLYFGMIGDKADQSSGIIMNDPLYHIMSVDVIAGGYEVTATTGALMLKPEPGSYMAMQSLKTGFRKFKGDDAKVLAGFVKYFKKLKELVNANESSIYGREHIKDKYFK